jgi:hypothetical protein
MDTGGCLRLFGITSLVLGTLIGAMRIRSVR